MLPFFPARFGTPAALAGQLWTPRLLLPLVWYDAQQEVLSNGAALATVTDFSGNSRNLTQGTPANQGVFSTTGFPGSKPELQFDGVNDFAERTDVGGYTLNGPFTWWVVARMRGSTSARTPFMGIGQSGSPGNLVTIEANTFSTAGSKMGWYATGNTYDSAASTSSDAFVLVVNVSSATASASIASNTVYRFNRSVSALTLNIGVGTWSAMTGMNRLALGSFAGVGVYGNCGIGEAGMVDRSLTADEVTALEAYIQTKWGV